MRKRSPLAIVTVLVGLAEVASGFTSPEQPWASADGRIRMLRPAMVQVSSSQQPIGSLMSSGWRLVWSGRPDEPGTMAVRLSLPVAPTGPGQAIEVLQIGWSESPAARRSCLTFGMEGAGSHARLPSRVINGIRYTASTNGDSGMSQQIDATDLQAVADSRCYAVERFSYATTAADRDPAVTLTQRRGAAILDAALASLHLGPGAALTSPALHVPRRTRAF